MPAPNPSAKRPHKPHKPRKPTLASVAKQASKAALEVARYEVKPDGSIVIVTGKGEQQQGNEVDEWIAKHADKAQGHQSGPQAARGRHAENLLVRVEGRTALARRAGNAGIHRQLQRGGRAKVVTPQGKLLSVLQAFQASGEFTGLAERTRLDYVEEIKTIEKPSSAISRHRG